MKKGLFMKCFAVVAVAAFFFCVMPLAADVLPPANSEEDTLLHDQLERIRKDYESQSDELSVALEAVEELRREMEVLRRERQSREAYDDQAQGINEATVIGAAAAESVPDMPGEESTVLDAETADQLFVRGEVMLHLGEFAEAERLFRQVLAAETDHLDARIGLATIPYQRGQMALARREFQVLATDAPDNEEVMGMLGLIAWRQGRLKDAEEILVKALQRHPRSARLRNYMGVVWYAQGEYDRAERELLHAIELDDELDEALFNLAVLLCTPEKASLNEARIFYERALQLGRERHAQLERILYE